MLLMALAGCGGEEESGGGEATPSPQLVEVVAKDFSFVPLKLSGTVGAPIEVTLRNTGQVAHTFSIDEFIVDTEVAAGEETTVTLLPPEPGEFNYYCRFHQGRGMLGAITITGGAGAGASPTREATTDADDYRY